MLSTAQAIAPRPDLALPGPAVDFLFRPVPPLGAPFGPKGEPGMDVSRELANGLSRTPAMPEPRAIILHFGRDEEIVAQDDAATYCYLIVSGCVRTVRLMEDGRRQIGEFLFAGDVFGWEALDQHDFGAEAVTQVVIRRYTHRDLDRLADQTPEVAKRMRELLSRRIRSGREHMVRLGRMAASERIASFLMQMASMLPNQNATIALPMSRVDIGDYLGLTIETVCRQLTRLRQRGTIEIDGAKIVICNKRALLAGGCEQVVH